MEEEKVKDLEEKLTKTRKKLISRIDKTDLAHKEIKSIKSEIRNLKEKKSNF